MIPLLTPPDWYQKTEHEVESWDSLKSWIGHTLEKNQSRTLVWRGLPHYLYANLSSLARFLAASGRGIPSERELRLAERQVLDLASGTWRLAANSPVELFAKMQHLGAPTRLIDVTKSPYVAAWFACQSADESDQLVDGRILGFGITKQQLLTAHKIPEAANEGDQVWSGDGDIATWGSYRSKVNVWFPPFDTHTRIFAQNAGFIFQGSPVTGVGTNSAYRRPKGAVPPNFSKEQILNSTSLHMNLVESASKMRDQNGTPVINARIKESAKNEILKRLNREHGINIATLFPDIEGLSSSLAQATIASLLKI